MSKEPIIADPKEVEHELKRLRRRMNSSEGHAWLTATRTLIRNGLPVKGPPPSFLEELEPVSVSSPEEACNAKECFRSFPGFDISYTVLLKHLERTTFESGQKLELQSVKVRRRLTVPNVVNRLDQVRKLALPELWAITKLMRAQKPREKGPLAGMNIFPVQGQDYAILVSVPNHLDNSTDWRIGYGWSENGERIPYSPQRGAHLFYLEK